MNALLIALFALVAAMYLAATIGYAVQYARESAAEISRWHYAERTGTIGTHLLFLTALGFAYGQLPLVGGFNMLTLLALALAVIHTVLEFRLRTRETGLFFFGLALALHLASWPAVAFRPEPTPLFQSPLFGIHVAAALLGYAGFLVSAVYGILYLVLYRMLKARRFNLVVRKMPPLDLLARMNLLAAVAGFVCLTAALALGVALGIVMAAHLPDVHFAGDAKFIQSLAAWLVYGLLLTARYALGWKGPRQAFMTIAGFALTAVSAWLVHLLFETFHNFTA
jgi:ABC-type transport system involved in cytochrome c biogenesis permease subunit